MIGIQPSACQSVAYFGDSRRPGLDQRWFEVEQQTDRPIAANWVREKLLKIVYNAYPQMSIQVWCDAQAFATLLLQQIF